MDPSELKDFVLKELRDHQYQPGNNTVGIPWSDERLRSQLDSMHSCLIDPYESNFVIRDGLETSKNTEPVARFVVAEDEQFKMFYDPPSGLFHLASLDASGNWSTFGVYGDAVGTFLAR